MEKINLSAAFAEINKLLPENLSVEKFITNRQDSYKEFIFEAHVAIHSGTFGELVHGTPDDSVLRSNRSEVERTINDYTVSNLDKVLNSELNKYLQQKTSIYIDDSDFVANLSNYCKENCNTCHATGRTKCEPCLGVGYVSCNRCHGSGKIYSNTSKSKQPTVQSCHYCNNGRAQCTNCLSSGFITCDDCNGETFNSWVFNGYFKTDVNYKTIFEPGNDKSEFAIAVRNMPVQKALSVCKFEQFEHLVNGSKFIIRYKASLPVTNLELSIHGKTKNITVLSNNGDLCESVALLDYILQPIVAECTNYLADKKNNSTVKFYKEIVTVPFIKSAINNLSSSSKASNIVDDLEVFSMGNMSISNLDIIARALNKSLSYKPKEIIRSLTVLVALPNLFIGALLAYGFISDSTKFIWGALEAAITLGIATSILASVLVFIFDKFSTTGLPKIFHSKSNGLFKRIFGHCVDYCVVMVIIGLVMSSSQYDYVVKKFNLTDRYAVTKTNNNQAVSNDGDAQPAPKKHKKTKH